MRTEITAGGYDPVDYPPFSLLRQRAQISARGVSGKTNQRIIPVFNLTVKAGMVMFLKSTSRAAGLRLVCFKYPSVR